jgi:CRISPR-associated protein Cmr6
MSQVAAPWYLKYNFEDAPPGHRYLMYLPFWGYQWQAIKEGKADALRNLCSIPKHAQDLMKELALRQQAIANAGSAEIIDGVSVSPFATGLGWDHPNENGFAFLQPYGLPYLAGSGVKGVVRRAAEELALLEADTAGWDLAVVWHLFGFEASSAIFFNGNNPFRQAFDKWISQIDDGKADCESLQRFIRVVDPSKHDDPIAFLNELLKNKTFRQSIHSAGALRFLDVIPVLKHMGVDIMNPHYGDYYQGKKLGDSNRPLYPDGATPHDAGMPIPIFFLVVPCKSEFTFVVDCPREHLLPDSLQAHWRELVRTAFAHAFDWLGFGAKTAVGYGAIREFSAEELATKQAEKSRCEWVDETLLEIAKKNNVPEGKRDEVLRGRPLAEAWNSLADSALKEKALVDIRARWIKKGWWDEPPQGAAKKALQTYKGTG